MRSAMNLFQSIKTPAILSILIPFIVIPAFADPQASLIDAQRREAVELIYSGQVDQAGPAVLNSLRALTTDDGAAIDMGFGSVNLEMFILGSLYEKEDWAAASSVMFDPGQTEMDRFLYNYFKSMCGLPMQETVTYRREIIRLAHEGQTPAVRAYACLVLSDPYWAYAGDEAEQARLWLAENYPGSQLARTAMWFPLVKYKKREGLRGILRVLDYRTLSDAERTYRRADPLYTALKDAFGAGLERDLLPAELQTGLTQVIQLVETSDDWLLRYTAVHVLKLIDDDASQAQYNSFVARLAERQVLTPDVVRARRIAYSRARQAKDLPNMERYMAMLYECHNRTNEVCERDLYEDLYLAAIQDAEALAEWGYADKAAEACQRIADTYPGTASARALSGARFRGYDNEATP